uniref:Small ribosomal subunit protein uS14c n=1 Tax=Pedobesia claviformis TaxID=2364088 RepID=A0A386B0V1_9CHLO|nr:ribosomal protein S14 [Pedobesia claviformis]AYC65317.1 ribosomal protein S14 [Pedobesia claviformis]
MARKAIIQRQIKRKVIAYKFNHQRKEYKLKIGTAILLNEKLYWHCKLQKLPRDSSLTRQYRRCLLSGRPRGYFRFFELSRHFVREYAHQGFLPGVIKSSW